MTEAPREATARPWKVSGMQETHEVDIVAPWSEDVSAEHADGWGDFRGVVVARLPYVPGESVPNESWAKANARLIVRAVNAHDALVEALREIAEHEHPGNTLSGYHDLRAIASAALASLTDEESAP